jgi:hypothetical protein
MTICRLCGSSDAISALDICDLTAPKLPLAGSYRLTAVVSIPSMSVRSMPPEAVTRHLDLAVCKRHTAGVEFYDHPAPNQSLT